jgi:hypothetical protein
MPLDIVKLNNSAVNTNGPVTEGSATKATRQGLYNVYVPSVGRYASFIPWDKIKTITVKMDRAYVDTFSNQQGYIEHDSSSAQEDPKAKFNWYWNLRKNLHSWAMQSGDFCQMPDGSLVHNMATPKIIIEVPGFNRDFDVSGNVINVNSAGDIITPNGIKKRITYHYEYVEYAYSLMNNEG